MRVALATVCYRERRLIGKFLKHVPSWVDTKLVLLSAKPWNGAELEDDGTGMAARRQGAITVESAWTSEEDQRNAGQELLSGYGYDWIIWLDPDEMLDNHNWDKLRRTLETSQADALVVEKQRVVWKDKEVSPCNDYQQLIAARPHLRFVDKRVIGSGYDVAPVSLWHFSWAKTDEEVWNKISHYSHAKDFDIKEWYEEVWLNPDRVVNLHPTTPETLGGLIDLELPRELKRLKLLP